MLTLLSLVAVAGVLAALAEVTQLSTGCHKVRGATLEVLDYLHVECEEGKALLSWKMVSTDCDTANGEQRIEYRCKTIPGKLTEQIERLSDCSLFDGKTLEWLDRNKASCADNEVMEGFWLDTTVACTDDNNLRFTVYCRKLDSARIASTANPTSGCKLVKNQHLEMLGQHDVNCGDNAFMTSWKMRPNNCADSKQTVEMACASVVEIGAADCNGVVNGGAVVDDCGVCGGENSCITQHEGNCRKVSGETLDELDYDYVECPDGKALLSWKMTSNGCNTTSEGGIEYRCKTIPGKLGKMTERVSACSLLDDKTLEYLDRTEASCADNEVMQGFWLDGADCIEDKHMQFIVWCRELDSARIASTSNPTSGCYLVKNQHLEMLGLHDVNCGSNNAFMTSWKMRRNICAGSDQTIEMACASVVEIGSAPAPTNSETLNNPPTPKPVAPAAAPTNSEALNNPPTPKPVAPALPDESDDATAEQPSEDKFASIKSLETLREWCKMSWDNCYACAGKWKGFCRNGKLKDKRLSKCKSFKRDPELCDYLGCRAKAQKNGSSRCKNPKYGSGVSFDHLE